MLRPTISVIADSRSGIPWPVTAQVKISLLKEKAVSHFWEADTAQSILLITKIIGEVDPDAICEQVIDKESLDI